MGNKIRLILLFYRSFAFLSNVVTAIAVGLLLKTGEVQLLPGFLLLKIAVLGVIYWTKREYGRKTLYYFTNRGLSPRELWGWSILLDLAIFAICITVSIIAL
jgi:hypothetical protein